MLVDRTGQSGGGYTQSDEPADPNALETGKVSPDEQKYDYGDGWDDALAGDTTNTDDGQQQDDYVAEAVGFGFTEDEAKSFGSRAAFQAAANAMLRRLQPLSHQAQAGMYQPQVPVQQPGQAQPEIEPFNLQLSDDVDETVADQLKKMNDHYHKQLQQVYQDMSSVRGEAANAQTRYIQQEIASFDNFIEQLPDAFKNVLGQGSSLALPMGSPQRQARAMLLQQAENLTAMNPGMSREAGLKFALQMQYPQQFQQIARDEVNHRVKRRSSQAMPRPRRHGTPAIDPRREAVNFAKETIKEKQ